jgi:hypothetical protein
VKELIVARCPTLEELLQAADSELSPEAHATVLQHLQQCAICQARDRHAFRILRDVQGYLAGAFGEERQQARQHEFQLGLHKLKQTLIHQSIGWPLRRWLPMAALMPVFIVALLLSRTGTVVLQADEILQRAVNAERMRPRGAVQRVRVRLMPPGALALPPRATASFTIVQELTDGLAPVGLVSNPSTSTAAGAASAGAASAGAAVALSAVPMSLAHRLATHHFDWRRPMDVERFNAWRATLTHKQDQVIAFTDTPHLLLRTTTTDDTDLLEAELTVQRDDFHVVRAAFVFDGVGRLEIEELAQWVRRPASSATVMSTETAADAGALAHDALVRAELGTRLLLAETGLDLPGTMHVSREAAQVRIDGAWPSAAQRRALNGRLLALPRVTVHLRVTDDDASDDASVAGHAYPLRDGTPLSRFLEQAFGDARARDAFVPELWRLTTAVRQRLGVMQELAQRYPDSEIRAFSAEARATWQQLLEWHYQQLRADMNGLDTRMRVLGGSESRAFPASTLPVDWPRRATAGLTQAITFDRLVQELLAQQDLPSSEQDRGQDSLSRTFRALWDAVVGSRQSHAARAES